MPTCRRKRVVLTEPSPALLEAFKKDPSRDVFYLERTGELFETYDGYAARMSFYRQKQFQCEVTGKSGLNYFEALDSEELEARTMHSRFPEPLKAPILKAVQWQVIGRLDHLIEAVYDRFKDRYFIDERVFVDIQGERYYARVMEVFPPRSSLVASTTSPFPTQPEEGDQIHKLASDLKLPVKDANIRDDPQKYLYKIQIHEDNKERAATIGPSDKPDTEKSKWSGSLMEVQCPSMSRDRLTFSKSILRRFIRDCVNRDAAVASPWVVKKFIADKYGVSSIMPDETRKGVENLRKGEMEKRKKAWEEKEGPSTKKQKKEPEPEKPKAPAPPPPEKKKKKPLRYPAEDMDVTLPERDKKAGAKVQRPIPSRELPFREIPQAFEQFLMVWNYLNVYGIPLHLSTFTLDEFEAALRHNTNDPPCTLIAEIHATLIYNLRTVPFVRQAAIASLEGEHPDSRIFGVTPDSLIECALPEVGNNWERVPLRASEGREGWEDALVGCLKDHASGWSFPSYRSVLTWLLLEPKDPPESPGGSSPSIHSDDDSPFFNGFAKPNERYWSMPVKYKIALLSFMCGLSVSSKAIHLHMESCEEQLTALRKEKIEINRGKKQAMEEIANLTGGQKKDAKDLSNGSASTLNGNGSAVDPDVEMPDSSDLSDCGPDSGATSEAGSAAGGSTKRSSSRGQSLRRKAQAKSREISRSNAASARRAAADLRKLEEEVNKSDRRLEAIEREFRKLLGCIRVKPMGKDRFHNRIWWFDGLGSGTLVASGGGVVWGTGRVFIQGPSELDQEMLDKRQGEEGDVEKRRLEEEGEEGILGENEWAAYSDDPEQVEELVAWLNTKGIRENALKNNLMKWITHITHGIRKRQTDMTAPHKVQEARRSSRSKGAQDANREPHMSWTNRRATNNSS